MTAKIKTNHFSTLLSLGISRVAIALRIELNEYSSPKMSGAAPIQRRERNDEDVEFDETEESGTVNGLIYDKVYEVAEKFAGTYVGQYATGKVDRLLKLVEDTAKWSLPQSS